ncbi:PREDICTED: FBD-associated F-box protein At5g38590-like [Erythranthe guttata]|uniref:FBD-associated F-box protein At5g38590-like n=1 Tax=Erythranthe guttata TaxID=4155 RepID=UPI00064D7578|nr:PREDICTED: FBD-associated F-box protein At5g38590-like [Erythranthe guttata]|eukprot:XP_012830631.1 PREDICTED: FBD-associated F-box protein At5g38590-like [Erythranthe guttata]
MVKKMDRISELPKDVLRKILYFLSQEEAARTSILSKPWRYIWCTRPNLDFSYAPPPREGNNSHGGVRNKINKDEFLSIVDNALRRCHDQNVCVEEFRLSTSLGDLDHESVSFLEKWAELLSNMGTKKFDLSLLSDHAPGRVELPPVVFGSESLQRLHVERFVLDEKAIERLVPLKHLKSLSLQEIVIQDEVVFGKIIANCPLIENLDVQGLVTSNIIKVDDLRNLKKLKFHSDVLRLKSGEQLCSIEIHRPSSLETLKIQTGNISLNKGAEFLNLKKLYLSYVESPLDHLSSCKFPSLEYLKFNGCNGLKGIRVFIDAPKLVYFEYTEKFVPSIYIATASEEWKSSVNLWYKPSNDPPSLFFPRLKELLESLSQSKIYLNLTRAMHYNNEPYVIPENIQNGCDGDKYVAVESLNFFLCLPSFRYILNGFFGICRPRYVVGESRYCGDWDWKTGVTECLWKILIVERESQEEWFRDLEEARLEICGLSNRDEWRSITFSELSNYDHSEYHTRYALKWRGN